jgi:nucleoside-diphosphate-sugar epimerase
LIKHGIQTVVVWGVTGFVGKAVVDELISRGISVRGISRGDFSVPESWHGYFEHHRLDFQVSREDLGRVLDGASFAIHCAGHFNAEAKLQDVFVDSVGNLSQAAVDEGLEGLILLSSLAVYGLRSFGFCGIDSVPAPTTLYGASRLRAEEIAHKVLAGCRPRLFVVRVPAVVGAGMKSIVLTGLFRTLQSGFFIHPGSQESVLACVGVKRLAAVIASLMTFSDHVNSELIQIVDNLKWVELVNEYGKLTGVRFVRIPLPGQKMLALCQLLKITIPGPLFALASEAAYENTTINLPDMQTMPETMDDIRDLIKKMRG